MAKRTVYSDEENRELDFFINEQGKMFIGITGEDKNDPMGSGFVTLNKEDIVDLIRELQKLVTEMEE